MKISTRTVGWGAFIIITLAALLSVAFFYQVLFPQRVLDVKSPLPLNVSSPTVQAGKTLSFQLDYCKHRTIDSNITISFADGVIIPSLNSVKAFPTGCHRINQEVVAPLSAHPGKYKMIINIDYHISSFVTEHHELVTKEFEITPLESNQTIIIQQFVSQDTQEGPTQITTSAPRNTDGSLQTGPSTSTNSSHTTNTTPPNQNNPNFVQWVRDFVQGIPGRLGL